MAKQYWRERFWNDVHVAGPLIQGRLVRLPRRTEVQRRATTPKAMSDGRVRRRGGCEQMTIFCRLAEHILPRNLQDLDREPRNGTRWHRLSVRRPSGGRSLCQLTPCAPWLAGHYWHRGLRIPYQRARVAHHAPRVIKLDRSFHNWQGFAAVGGYGLPICNAASQAGRFIFRCQVFLSENSKRADCGQSWQGCRDQKP